VKNEDLTLVLSFEYNCMIAKELIPAFLQRSAKDERYMHLVFGESYNASEECF
jgi:hypothetical protein